MSRVINRARLRTMGTLVSGPAAERRRLARGWFFDIARYVTPYLAVEGSDGTFFVDTADGIVGRQTFVDGSFDRESMDRIMRALVDATGRPRPLGGRDMFDIGANIGTTSISALVRHGARSVVAFEPAPANLRLLRLNALVNGVAERVDVRTVALSDRDGSVTLELSPDNSGDHRVRVGPLARGTAGEEARGVVEVPARRLDGLVDEGSLRLEHVGLVWMDAQGHEAQILAGASSIFDSGIPMVIEYWPYGLRRAGGLEALQSLVAERVGRVIEVPPYGHGTREHAPDALAAIGPLDETWWMYTDLVLLPR